MLLVVHAGADSRGPSKAVIGVISTSLSVGYKILEKNGSALHAIVESIRIFESVVFMLKHACECDQ
ncbi:MAG: hypothetical protein ACLPX5_08115 [Dissulfurispiraceae bacterium]